jgi:hypothetical protein
VNYQGEPFMEALSHTSTIGKIMIINFVVVIAAILEMADMDYYLELVKFPNEEFKYELLAVFLGVLGVNYAIETILRKIKYRT